jgi:hypothetical protein
LFLGRDRWWRISESKPVLSFVILSQAKDLNRSITPVDGVRSFLAKWLHHSAEKMQDEKTSCKGRSRISMSGNSCQAALHGCLPAETAAIYFAALQRPPSGGHLRKQTRCAKLPYRKRRAASPQPVLFPEKLNCRSVSRFS